MPKSIFYSFYHVFLVFMYTNSYAGYTALPAGKQVVCPSEEKKIILSGLISSGVLASDHRFLRMHSSIHGLNLNGCLIWGSVAMTGCSLQCRLNSDSLLLQLQEFTPKKLLLQSFLIIKNWSSFLNFKSQPPHLSTFTFFN